MVLGQESLAPGSEEALQFDFGDDRVASSVVRGHAICVSTSGVAIVLHRNWAFVF